MDIGQINAVLLFWQILDEEELSWYFSLMSHMGFLTI